MRKGQAAIEFLTTYGWAFLVILVMIGALAYFGVLNPSGLLPARCTFSPEVACLDHRISGTTLDLRIRNNVGQMATFTFSATELSKDEAGTCTITTDDCAATATCEIKSGRIANVSCGFTNNFPTGDKIKFEVSGSYTKSGGFAYPVKGEVYGEAQ
jgi:hypothetical protein